MKKKYVSDIENLMADIHTLLSKDPSTAIPLCKQLLRLGQAMQDNYLRGYAYYHMDVAYYNLGITDKVLENHTRELNYLTLSSQYKYIINSHNYFGMIAASQNNTTLALDSYLQALDLTKKHRYTYMQGIVYNNIGELYKGIGQFQDALPYFRKAESYCRRDESWPYYHSNLLLIHTALCFCSYHLNDAASVTELLTYLDENDALAEDRYHLPAVLCLKFCCYHKFGTPEQCAAIFPDLLQSLQDCSLLYDFYTYFWEVCHLLSESHRYEQLIQVLDILETKLSREQQHTSTFLILRLYSYKVHYYKEIQDQEGYNHALEQYHRYKEAQIRYSREFIRSTLDYRIRMEQLKQEQASIEAQIQQLRHKSERDALTGLANYAYLTVRIEQMFDDAFQRQVPFGVAILDIDYFKQYNDTYGHQAGDDVLITISAILKKLETEQIFCARYGGDEFILLFLGMTDDQILRVCEQIKQELASRQIPHKSNPSGDYVSVSQGVRNSIPTSSNKSWDYLFAADMALYDVKGHHRSGILLVHQYSLPENMSRNGGDHL